MIFKYQSYHDQFQCECPPLDKYKSTIRKSFRWVHDDINHKNNFLPPLLITDDKEEFDDARKCGNLALSFFISLEKAEKRYLNLIGKVALFSERVGNSIAEGTIYERDGVANLPNKIGHFDLHEDINADFTGRFTIIKKIKL